jgi:hypothetical protein
MAAEDAAVATKAEKASFQAATKKEAPNTAGHHNQASIPGPMASVPTTAPPAPPRKPATKPPPPCKTCSQAEPNSVSGCDGVGPT